MKHFFAEYFLEIIGVSCLIFLVLALTAVLIGTRKSAVDASDNPNRFRIESGGSNVGVALVTDRDTGVQYLMNTRTGGFTVLIDKDGKPIIANGWRDFDE